jgi:hypothetical protein
MSGQMISDERVISLIETYGADPDMFPEAERISARARMQQHPDRFALAIEAAREIDALLGVVPDVVTSGTLRSALIASAPKVASVRKSGWKLPVWIPAGALASLAVGVFAGMSVAQPVTTQNDQAEAAIYASLGFDTYTLDLEEEALQ